MLCYLPKWLWDMWEGNLLSTIVLGLNYGMIKEEEKEIKKKTLVDYMMRHIRVSFAGVEVLFRLGVTPTWWWSFECSQRNCSWFFILENLELLFQVMLDIIELHCDSGFLIDC